jgi:hypothetical protein
MREVMETNLHFDCINCIKILVFVV